MQLGLSQPTDTIENITLTFLMYSRATTKISSSIISALLLALFVTAPMRSS